MREPNTFYLEFSRSPQGVAMGTTSASPQLPVEMVLESVLLDVAKAARSHHGDQKMLPSYRGHDYLVRTKSQPWDNLLTGESGGMGHIHHVFLRDDHPWWQGPIAARVARRNNVTAEQWRRMNHLAYQFDKRPDQIYLPEMTLPKGAIRLA